MVGKGLNPEYRTTPLQPNALHGSSSGGGCGGEGGGIYSIPCLMPHIGGGWRFTQPNVLCSSGGGRRGKTLCAELLLPV